MEIQIEFFEEKDSNSDGKLDAVSFLPLSCCAARRIMTVVSLHQREFRTALLEDTHPDEVLFFPSLFHGFNSPDEAGV